MKKQRKKKKKQKVFLKIVKVNRCPECGYEGEEVMLPVMFLIGKCEPTITPPICGKCRKKFKVLSKPVTVGEKIINMFWEWNEEKKEWNYWEHYGLPTPDGVDSLDYWNRCVKLIEIVRKARNSFICVQKGMSYPYNTYTIVVKRVTKNFVWFYVKGENIVKRYQKKFVNQKIIDTLNSKKLRIRVGLQIKSSRANFYQE